MNRLPNPFADLNVLAEYLEDYVDFFAPAAAVAQKAYDFLQKVVEGKDGRSERQLLAAWKEKKFPELGEGVAKHLKGLYPRIHIVVSHAFRAAMGEAKLRPDEIAALERALDVLEEVGPDGDLAPLTDPVFFAPGSAALIVLHKVFQQCEKVLKVLLDVLASGRRAEPRRGPPQVRPPSWTGSEKRAIALSRRLTSKDKTRAGPFLLVNAVGVSDEILLRARRAAEQAARAYEAAGLGYAAYGQITMVRKTKGFGDTTAFYVISLNEIFLLGKADEQDMVHSLCHELAHRLEYTVLRKIQGFEAELQSLHAALAKNEAKMARTAEDFPSAGDRMALLHKGPGRYVYVEASDRARNQIVVRPMEVKPGGLALMGDSVNITYARWRDEVLRIRPEDYDENFDGFVTAYALEGGPGENFAEMLGLHVLGRLPPKLARRLSKIVPLAPAARAKQRPRKK